MSAAPISVATAVELAAVRHLLTVAQSDTGQSRRCADFLLAWWNAEENGGFDLVDTWAVDGDIAADMVRVFVLIARTRSYPNTLDPSLDTPFRDLWKQWRGHKRRQAA